MVLPTKSYPRALHMYKVLYRDDSFRVLYACGMTHAHATSREYWPGQEIESIIQLDDSWKN
jgi:hypothetical protein